MQKYERNKNNIIMTRDQVRAFDAWAINILGIPAAVLMENAGRSCAQLIIEKLADRPNPSVCIFCGTGNNGGDGYVIARHLLNHSFKTKVFICGDPAAVKGHAKRNLDILKQLHLPSSQIDPDAPDLSTRIRKSITDADMLVDAVFGTGLKGTLRPEYRHLIQILNDRRCPLLAVDIPSGLDCDTGQPLGDAVRADYTVTFVAVKKGFTTAETALSYTGEIFIASIGVTPLAQQAASL